MGTMQTAGAQWHIGRHRYSRVVHADPQACADNLAREARQLARDRAALEAERAWISGSMWIFQRGQTIAVRS
jgi:hypothetical protein